MKSSASGARRAVAALGARGKTTRIPEEVRFVVQGYAEQARSGGESWSQVAETVGLSTSVLQRWHRAGKSRAKPRPVVIADSLPSAERTGLVVVTATGERLEGLDVEDALRILRGLR